MRYAADLDTGSISFVLNEEDKRPEMLERTLKRLALIACVPAMQFLADTNSEQEAELTVSYLLSTMERLLKASYEDGPVHGAFQRGHERKLREYMDTCYQQFLRRLGLRERELLEAYDGAASKGLSCHVADGVVCIRLELDPPLVIDEFPVSLPEEAIDVRAASAAIAAVAFLDRLCGEEKNPLRATPFRFDRFSQVVQAAARERQHGENRV